MLRVVVERNGEVVWDRSIDDRLIAFGRAEDNDLVLADEKVSSHHFVVKKGGDGVFTAIDQSANGMFYEGQKVTTLRIERPVVLVVAGYEVTLIPAKRSDTVDADVPDGDATTVTDDFPVLPKTLKTKSRAGATLRLAREDGRVESVTFMDSAIIGRDEDCDLRIPSREVSRRHAFLFRRGEEYLVKRLSKVNLVRVNETILREGESHVLTDRDVIDVSGHRIQFLEPESVFGARPTLVDGHQPNLGFSMQETWEKKEVVRVELLGFLGEKTVPRFEPEVNKLLPDARKLIVDLGYLIGIDENGLSALVRLAADCDRSGTRLVLDHVGPRVLDALRGSSMRKVLEPYIDRDDEMKD